MTGLAVGRRRRDAGRVPGGDARRRALRRRPGPRSSPGCAASREPRAPPARARAAAAAARPRRRGTRRVTDRWRVDDDLLGDLTRAEESRRVREAVLTLPVRYREAVVLCDLQELSYADAAAALGCAVGTVRSRLHRGRALLAAKLTRSSRSAPGRRTRRANRRTRPHRTGRWSSGGPHGRSGDSHDLPHSRRRDCRTWRADATSGAGPSAASKRTSITAPRARSSWRASVR